MTKLILVAFAATAIASAALAFPGQGWGCRDCGYLNGTQLTGIAINVADSGVTAISPPSN